MATRQEEFITGEGLDDLYALLNNSFLDEDVDFEKVIEESPGANFCLYECSKVFKTQRGLTRQKNTKHSSNRCGCSVSVRSEEIIQKKNYIQMCCLELSMSVQKSVSMTCVYLKSVEIFFEKILRVYI